ncbi:MAG: metallophosphoesterase, partial [Candidatus Eisenbacteria bacterium]|nr:metallophosphoesterase [Candidatus Eisenbacteria bacterium]
MRVLLVGDVMGRPGRRAVREILPRLRRERDIAFCIANGENLAGGAGVTRKTADDVFRAGVDVLTGGNHTWDNKEVFDVIDDRRILRPANYPPGTPGRGCAVYETEGGAALAVLNLLGRVLMNPVDCPFRAADALLGELGGEPIPV